MSKYCPILKRKVVYLECLECEDKICKKDKQKNVVTVPVNINGEIKNKKQ